MKRLSYEEANKSLEEIKEKTRKICKSRYTIEEKLNKIYELVSK